MEVISAILWIKTNSGILKKNKLRNYQKRSKKYTVEGRGKWQKRTEKRDHKTFRAKGSHRNPRDSWYSLRGSQVARQKMVEESQKMFRAFCVIPLLQMNISKNEWMDLWYNERIDEWRMNRWMNKWTNESVNE